ncbi:MAG: hypothetical protein MK132_22380 [Lentisphaerales bacterium]|nr:hypothetical protein [Lentisphaerales bacterium]
MPNKAPNCLKCKHFFVTYDKRSPRGCKLFGMKNKGLPSQAVFNSTGSHCPAFEERQKLK